MKSKAWKILSYVLVALVAASLTLIGCLLTSGLGGGKLQELEDLLSDCFIGNVDQKKLEDHAAAAMVAALGDRWSYYMTAEEYLAYQDAMSNSYVGVGITVQVREDGRGFDITNVTSGSPAGEAGLLAGDRLIAVDGTSIVGKDIDEASGLIRGKEGTKVELTVDRAGKEQTFTVERRRFQTPVATHRMLDGGVGLVTIENFDSRCAEETIVAIEALLNQGATSMIFDVRNNPGGYAQELVEVLDYLLPEGEIFRTVDYRGNEEVERSDKAHLDIPMAVLVNLHSYSAAEFFAAALDEYEAAIVVGEKTFGKGYFQSTFELRDGSAVALSIGKYYTPKGNSLAGVGLTPDVEKAVDQETAAQIYAGTLNPREDPQILAAMDALRN